MGRSKFPGKPSKLVNKKRVSVLQTSEENNLINYENDEYLSNDQISLWNSENETTTFGGGGGGHGGDDVQNHPVSQATEKPPSSEPPDGGGGGGGEGGGGGGGSSGCGGGGGKHRHSSSRTHNSGVVTRARNTSHHHQHHHHHQQLSINNIKIDGSLSISKKDKSTTISSTTPSTTTAAKSTSTTTTKSTSTTEKPVKKKTVTFKNVLETSDDAGAVRKVYNPDNAPLVPIIKKECLSRSVRLARSDCIVRPSRLTEILKNNAANNIDKLNYLKFRSISPSIMDENVPSLTNIETMATTTTTTMATSLSPGHMATLTSSSATSTSGGVNNSDNSNNSNNKMEHGTNNNNSRTTTGSNYIGSEDNSRHDTVAIVGDKRFILPKRSMHSCRVIKPNKRFLDDIEISTRNSRKSSSSSVTAANGGNSGTGSSKRQLKKQQQQHHHYHQHHQQQQANEAEDLDEKNRKQIMGGVSGSLGAATITTQQDSFINNTLSHKINSSRLNEEIGTGDIDDDLSETSHIATDDTQSDLTEEEDEDDDDYEDEIDNNKSYRTSATTNNIFNMNIASHKSSLFGCSTSKVILRQPRLQYDSQIGIGLLNQQLATTATAGTISTSNPLSPLSSSPFSLNLSNNMTTSSPLSLGGCNICGVCGTIINCKLLQQSSRKYGIFSCEACRKFISKTIKKLASSGGSPQSNNILQCNKGDGSCPITPLLKCNIKNFKKTYKERCPACWLKRCMRTFHVPSGFKNRLNSIIPASLRDNENNSTISTTIATVAAATSSTITTSSTTPVIGGITTLTSSPFISIKKENLSAATAVAATTTSTSGTASLSSTISLSSTSLLGTALDSTIVSSSSSSTLSTSSSSISMSNLFSSPPSKLLSWTTDNFGELIGIEKTTTLPPPLSNALAENNATFGGSPLIKSTLEKPVFIINNNNNNSSSSSSSSINSNILNSLSIENDSLLRNIRTTEGNSIIGKNSNQFSNSLHKTSLENIEENHLNGSSVGSNKIKLRRKERETVVNTQQTQSVTTPCEPPKRQRIDLKGPRVKHVCRSASIVLGQPIATFPNEATPVAALESIDTPPRPESPNNAEVELPPEALITSVTTRIATATEQSAAINCSTCTQANPSEQELALSPPATPIEDTRLDDECGLDEISEKIDNADAANSNSSSTNSSTTSNGTNSSSSITSIDKENKKIEDMILKPPLTRKLTRPALLATNTATMNSGNNNNNNSNSNNNNMITHPRNLNSFSKKIITQLPATPQKSKLPTKISIDFWENYDPAEVSQTGFGIIVTESIPMRALCFLCGSTGLDPLIFCACCCEPYHSYCVEDEYNLKHSSLDDTMTSLLDASINAVENVNIITNRLNWLCPRCTVCYTCNMSSGSKVKCQKCQKNYHTTCLGTSKRLLGADRPLICANCLKCKSCSTTKVTKFVGNLPMCSQCFKLRKKGNFCPLCQKCYEDNDFDLKMMECGDCQRWVHAKCEGLSDEQYNLLSTLPENIEFICKKCSKLNIQANLWREAVASEFKSGLLSVVKLLTKSRQACALLKLSPRKKTTTNCICQPPTSSVQTARSLQFKKLEGNDSNFSTDSKGSAGTDEESQNSEDILMDDVYEFKEQTTPVKCFCGASQKQLSSLTVPSLVDIKRKINSGDYVSLAEFNYDMNNVITAANCDELMIAYKEILSEAFPWFQNETKACTDALEEDMFDSCTFTQSNEDIECDQQVPVIDLPEDIEDCLYSPNKNDDHRICMFCKGMGEGDADMESRLLYCGQNSWVHINCAMWSAEVFEEIDGSLQNVHSAIARGRSIKCSVCGNRGATVGCNVKSCGEHYHYPCARKIDCTFMTDKSVYCSVHSYEANKKNAMIEKNFEVLRPVYVELDRKKKKLVEPSKVKFLIGSLEVKNIGKVFTKLSDTNEAIIPVDFLCTRLYWSIKEPWKIVEYTVKTTIQNNLLSFANDSGRNFTVDHSNNINMVQLGLAQIARWHNSLLLGEENEMGGFFRTERSSVKQLLEAVGQNINSDEATEEEPQNNADLLPPEIKDAIFEDLPHEILDGISMLDIFPKLMIYEDVIPIDSKAEGYYTTNEYTKDGTISYEDANETPSSNKDLELSNGWPISSSIISHVEDAMLSAVRPFGSSREIKRSKSEVFSRGISGGNRSQQRSSSLTSAAAVKRRKITKGLQDIRLPEGVLLSIGRRKEEFPACLERRRTSQNDDCRTKQFTWSAAKKYSQNGSAGISEIQEHCTSIISKDSIEKLKIAQLDGMDDLTGENEFGEFQQAQTTIYDPNSTEPVKCDRCNCTYRTHDSYQRHLATCEPLSTSESESETAPRSPEMQSPLTGTQTPISLMQSFNHQGLPTITNIQNGQTFGQTSTNIPTIQNVQIQNGIPITQINQGISNIFLTTTQNSTQQQTTHQTIAPTTIQQQQFLPTVQNLSQAVNSINQFTSVANANPTVSSTSQTISITTNGIQQTHHQQQQQQPQILTMSTTDGNQQVLTIGSQQAAAILGGNQQNRGFTAQTANIYQKPQLIRTQAEKTPSKGRQIGKIQQSPSKTKTKPTNATKPIQMKKNSPALTTAGNAATIIHQKQPEPSNTPQSIQILNQNIPTTIVRNQTGATENQGQGIVLQQNGNSQPIIVQQVGNTPNNLVSYVTTATDSHGQMQYVAVPASNDFAKQQQTQFLTTSPLVQGTFLQTDSSGNLVLTNASSGLQMLSAGSLQIAQPAQPQVIGTLIQPQTAATIQCGVMSAEQMVLGPTPTLEMVTNPTMLLTSQPVYYGLETIVQNTVMSSQQFVSTAMQGVLSQNASFSATTTQVFQASKIEPIMEVPAGYVVLNNVDGTTTIMQQPTTQTNIISTNVLQQPTIQQIHAAQPQQIHTQTVQPQQMNGQQIPSFFNIQQQQQQQQHVQQQQSHHQQPTVVQQHQTITTTTQPTTAAAIAAAATTTFQAHHIQPQLRAVSPAKPTAKSSPIVVTKIQPQIINKVVPNVSMATAATVAAAAAAASAANQPRLLHDQQKSTTIGNPIILSKTVALTSAVDNVNPIFVQTTAATGALSNNNNIITSISQSNLMNSNAINNTVQSKMIKSTPISMAAHHLPLKPKISSMNSMHQPSLMPIQPVQRKMNMIRPLNKVTSSSATSISAAVTIKPKVVTKPVSAKSSSISIGGGGPAGIGGIGTGSKSSIQSPPLIAPKPQQVMTTSTTTTGAATNIHNQKFLPHQHQIISSRGPGAGGIGQVINEQQLLEARKNLQAQLAQADSTADLNEQNCGNGTGTGAVSGGLVVNGTLISQANSTTASEDNNILVGGGGGVATLGNSGIQQHLNLVGNNLVTAAQIQEINSTGCNLYQTGNTNTLHYTLASTNQPSQTTINLPTSSSIIQLPSAPFVSPYGNNIPTNIVNPIQQVTNNNNTNNNNGSNQNNIFSRPTNRVLPMQTIQQKLLSPPTPPEPKLCIGKVDDKEMENDNNLKKSIPSTITATTLQYDILEKINMIEMQNDDDIITSNTAAPADVDGSPITHQQHQHDDNEESEKMYSIEVRINDEVFNVNTKTITNSSNDNNAADNDLKLMLTTTTSAAATTTTDSQQEEENEFDMKTDSDGIPDQDDLSESTPEVKEKICEILENLENEDCNKSPSLLDEGFGQSEEMLEENEELLERNDNEMLNENKNHSDEDMLDHQKENVDPLPNETLKAKIQDAISPIKVSDFMNSIGIQQLQQSNLQAMSFQQHQQQMLQQPQTLKPTGPRLLYEIQSEDGFTYKSTSITEIWEKVFEAVQVARKAHGLAPLPEGPLADMCGVQMLGLKTNALRYLIEQLPGVERCSKYTPKYHKKEQQQASSSGYSSDQEDLKENSYGSVRCEPFLKRSDYDMFSWLASRHRKQPIHVVIQPPDNELIPRRGTGSNLPMAMKYRTLKETYKDYVGVFRSHIHGRGLYCTKDIEAGEMVIEYAGELIRSTLTDKRERYYDSKGIGCYMFKIDENLVVDATMRGNAARFINHSCEPNCYSKVVDILGHKHIIIFALRRIVQGEELTYDYKFPFEEVKIPCSCGSKKCRKYLN